MAFFEVSLDTANAFYTWGWRLSLGGAIVTAVGIGILYWGTRVRDHDFESQMAAFNLEAAAARERAGNLEERAASLEKDAAQARSEIAQANARALEAQLALEKFKASRVLTSEQQASIASKIAAFKDTRFDMSVITGDPEAMLLLRQIADALEMAGWKWIEWNHPNGPLMFVYPTSPDKPNVGQGGGVGVNVEMHSDHVREFLEAAVALSTALNEAGIVSAVAQDASQNIPNHDTMHIIIGKKPQ